MHTCVYIHIYIYIYVVLRGAGALEEELPEVGLVEEGHALARGAALGLVA